MFAHINAITAILATTSSGLILLIVVLLGTSLLTPAAQGFFFAFLSLGSLIQIGDFGLSYAILQKASHFNYAPSGKLYKFESLARVWGLVNAIVSTILVGVFGFMSFSIWEPTPGMENVNWMLAWAIGLLGLFVGQCSSPVVSLLEGSGKIVTAWRLRMLQEWIGGISYLIAINLALDLFSVAIYWIGRSIVVLPLLFKKVYPVDRVQQTECLPKFMWRYEIWPFQWRIGLSNLSGYLIFRATTLVLLSEQGPVVAGKYGFALAMMNMMLAVTTSWPISQAARLGQLISENLTLAATDLANYTLKYSTLFAICSTIAVWGLFSFAHNIHLNISDRITDLGTLALILCTGVVHHIVACQAVLLRAQVREPLLKITVIGGVVNIISAFLASRYGSLFDVALSGLLLALVGLGVSTRLYLIQCNAWKNIII